MITSVADERISDVRTTDDELIVSLSDGRTLIAPLAWYPRLLHATEDERTDWRLIGLGHGIHWPQIDEDLSTEGLLLAVPAPSVRLAPADRDHVDQIVNTAQDFYGASLNQAKAQLESTRAELEGALEQLSEILEYRSAAEIQELVDSYASIISTLNKSTEQGSVEEPSSYQDQVVRSIVDESEDTIEITVATVAAEQEIEESGVESRTVSRS